MRTTIEHRTLTCESCGDTENSATVMNHELQSDRFARFNQCKRCASLPVPKAKKARQKAAPKSAPKSAPKNEAG